ncbi:hypothetical protein Pcinc_036451 [Petrolisthes cinctipes]|uniref:Uncharacterized protein n=1 Tax=Petrolisthes cinctipes TaxID=88211 RepID=A0AAE1BYJ2_PETCI|nr:hypothetical protein Pcinc_036451 [Petrolisthes cinctipes]
MFLSHSPRHGGDPLRRPPCDASRSVNTHHEKDLALVSCIDCCGTYFPDLPAPVPPLTPGTTKKMTDALRASFASWEKEREKHSITKDNCILCGLGTA